ncbi:hypothetical protein ABEF95_007057 [Exophiala dermatitidis]
MDVAERVKSALEMIPTCERCKRLRRKCDTELPSCRLCRAAHAKCEFKDHVLGEIVPRSQVKDLLDRWTALRQVEVELDQETDTWDDNPRSIPSATVHHRLNFDAHFPAGPNDGDDFVFFGASSAQVLSTELLAMICPESTLLQSQSQHQQNQQEPFSRRGRPDFAFDNGSVTPVATIVPTKTLILRLLDIYNRSCMVFWPSHLECMSDDEAIEGFFRYMIQQQEQHTDLQPDSHSQSHSQSHSRPVDQIGVSHANFQLAMICCIGCACASAHGNATMALRAYEDSFYKAASSKTKNVLSEATHDSLRSLMLVIIYLLFRPQKGDLWLHLESAVRLAIELGYHREDAPFAETPKQKAQRSRTFWTLYRLDHMVAETYGRPTDDLEAISTIELPHPTAVSSTSPRDVSMAHPHPHPHPPSAAAAPAADLSSLLALLSYIRSSIFKTVYLPSGVWGAGAPVTLDDTYYKIQLDEIEQWRRQTGTTATVNTGATTNVTSLACTIAYHSSVLFLFQKSMLFALSKLTEDSTVESVGGYGKVFHVASVAVQSFASAIALIDCYEALILSDDSELFSNYPVTFVSAHEIYVASLTFVAGCFCLLDGRIKLEDLSTGQQGLHTTTRTKQSWVFQTGIRGQDTRAERERPLHHISASCIALLTWCTFQWPGMSGMLEIYRELSSEVLPKMAAKGMV